MSALFSMSGMRNALSAAALTLAFAGASILPAPAQVKKEGDVRIVFVTHGQANDVYWSVVKNGMQAAASIMRAMRTTSKVSGAWYSTLTPSCWAAACMPFFTTLQ